MRLERLDRAGGAPHPLVVALAAAKGRGLPLDAALHLGVQCADQTRPQLVGRGVLPRVEIDVDVLLHALDVPRFRCGSDLCLAFAASKLCHLAHCSQHFGKGLVKHVRQRDHPIGHRRQQLSQRGAQEPEELHGLVTQSNQNARRILGLYSRTLIALKPLLPLAGAWVSLERLPRVRFLDQRTRLPVKLLL